MDLNEYQRLARKTAVYPRKMVNIPIAEHDLEVDLGIIYCSLKMVGEAGEYAEKVGKLIRGDYVTDLQQDAARLARMAELGDVLWYIANAANDEGYTLTEIAEANLRKLADRAERGTLKGSGDAR